MARFDDCLNFVLDREGRTSEQASGDINTSYGVTQPVYDEYRTSKGLARQDVDIADASELADIYLTRYWLGGKCDKLPPPLDLIHFDSRVNLGEGTANRMLQTALNVGIVDGIIGQGTLAAVASADPLVIGGRYCNLRITRYIVLSSTKPQLKKYLKGWLHRVGFLLQNV